MSSMFYFSERLLIITDHLEIIEAGERMIGKCKFQEIRKKHKDFCFGTGGGYLVLGEGIYYLTIRKETAAPN